MTFILVLGVLFFVSIILAAIYIGFFKKESPKVNTAAKKELSLHDHVVQEIKKALPEIDFPMHSWVVKTGVNKETKNRYCAVYLINILEPQAEIYSSSSCTEVITVTNRGDGASRDKDLMDYCRNDLEYAKKTATSVIIPGVVRKANDTLKKHRPIEEETYEII